MITHKQLKAALHYNPKTGIFTWLKRFSNRTDVGRKAGCLSYGYCVIRIYDCLYAAHRLAWFYMTKKWPREVDHINCNRSDNRWRNLRVATRSENCRNSPKQKRVKLKGAIRYRTSKYRTSIKYRSHIYVNKKNVHLGVFATAEEAHAAYVKAAKKYFGEFAGRH